MLVLSRRTDQQIVFPNLDIKLSILQVRGKVVKLGIDAPRDVSILRPETISVEELEKLGKTAEPGLDRHQLRNHLNAVNLGLKLFEKQTAHGMAQAAQDTMQRVVSELQKMDEAIGKARTQVKTVASSAAPKLLVVDDDENERTLLSGLLRMQGFEVLTASDGLEAMDLLSQGDLPDYVLLDMKMPNADGPSTIQKIRSDSRFDDVKVFAVSGTSPEVLGVQEGIEAWFPKPLDPERLIQAMSSQHTCKTMHV
ncbi:MAG: response regulator [Planctomycetaceae bacterium]|nr:response regulator [Planctomycetaceae bacterium]